MNRATLRDATGAVHDAVAAVSGATTVIDSSKRPEYVSLMTEAPKPRSSILHVVRDPRGAVWSRQRALRSKKGRSSLLGAIHDSRRWNLDQRAIGAMAGRPTYVRLRYEDFATDPRNTVAELAGRLGIAGPRGRWLDDKVVDLSLNHSFWGNRIRFSRGPTLIQADYAWHRDLPVYFKWAIDVVTRRERRVFQYE
jgi:Sulfotransferase family